MGGDTLVVAPGHLIPQWKSEIEKFTDEIEVVVGKRQYESRAAVAPAKDYRVVLVDVDTVLQEDKLWYDFRRVFSSKGGSQVRVHSQTMETYKQAALFCVKSPRGPCSYEGYVYTGHLHIPFRPWRRVVFDEIQDLVSEGTESQKNLLQLTRTAKNVWLLSATPFPHGNDSVHANHELLGFCRLRMDVEVNHDLPPYHPFEKIKRKLYIRSPKHVSDDAVTAAKKVTKETVYVDATELERKFYELEKNDIAGYDIFSEAYSSLRQMMVHPEASKKLREQINGKDEDQRGGDKAKKVKRMNNTVGRFATVNSFARLSLAQARERCELIEDRLIPDAAKDMELTRYSLNLAMKIRQVRSSPVQPNPFARREDAAPPMCMETLQADAIHQYYCRCSHYESNSCEADRKARFETLGSQYRPKVLIRGDGAVERIAEYFNNEMKHHKKLAWDIGEREALDVYIAVKEGAYTRAYNAQIGLGVEKVDLEKRIEALEATVKVGNMRGMSEDDELAARHGSKSAALIKHLQKIDEAGERTIVFSYWHDTLALVNRSLKKVGLSVAFCDGTSRSMSRAITDFTTGEVSILLLSAQAKASGANLQCATNVVLLDPAGSSAEHGATLEQQAIGRAVRMGQENEVKVVRFLVKDSIEEDLFAQIDTAARHMEKRSSDRTYTCEDSHKVLGESDELKEADPDDVCVGESVSEKERVARMFAAARAKDDVITIDDSDDEDEPQKKSKAILTSVASVASSASVKVKAEFASVIDAAGITRKPATKRTHAEAIASAAPVSSDKRAKISSNPTPAKTTCSECNEATYCTLIGIIDHERLCKDGKAAPVAAAPAVDKAAALSKLDDSEPPPVYEPMSPSDESWYLKLNELKKYKATTGIAFARSVEKTPLSRWCAAQRNQYKKYQINKKTSSLTEARIKALADIGFVWAHNLTPGTFPAPPIVPTNFNIVMKSHSGPDLTLRITDSVTLKTIFDTYVKTRNVPLKSLRFTLNGKELFSSIGSQRTASYIGLKENDVINVICSPFDEINATPATATQSESNVSRRVSVSPASDSTSRTTENAVDGTETTPQIESDELKQSGEERVVSTASGETEAGVDSGLQDLLNHCQLQQHVSNFNEAGIRSLGDLKGKLEDLTFMEQLVERMGLTATEAVRMQIIAAKQ